MPKQLIPVEKALALLSEQPARIAEITAGLNERQFHMPPEPNEWSCVELLGHLRTCADMWGQAIDTILAKDHPTFKAVNPRTWAQQVDYNELDFAPSFGVYKRQRVKLLKTLEALKPREWLRNATVLIAGKAVERSVHFYADWLAVHERTHVRQFMKTVQAVSKM